jgi:hypothetical protein
MACRRKKAADVIRPARLADLNEANDSTVVASILLEIENVATGVTVSLHRARLPR